jgi:hypothetical protein
VWIRSTLFMATAIATLALGSPAFAGGGRRPSTPEIRGRRITTRTGGTLDSRPRRCAREPHQGSSLQGLCHKMTGSGADRVTNNVGNGNCRQCRRQ